MKCYHTRLTTGREGDAGKIGICCKHYCHHYPGGLQRQWTVMNNMKTGVFFHHQGHLGNLYFDSESKMILVL